MDLIIGQNSDESAFVIRPTSEALSFATIQQIAEKDAPSGSPYWIRPESDVPQDRANREAWVIDPLWGEPDGFGGESNEFDETILAAYMESIA